MKFGWNFPSDKKQECKYSELTSLQESCCYVTYAAGHCGSSPSALNVYLLDKNINNWCNSRIQFPKNVFLWKKNKPLANSSLLARMS